MGVNLKSELRGNSTVRRLARYTLADYSIEKLVRERFPNHPSSLNLLRQSSNKNDLKNAEKRRVTLKSRKSSCCTWSRVRNVSKTARTTVKTTVYFRNSFDFLFYSVVFVFVEMWLEIFLSQHKKNKSCISYQCWNLSKKNKNKIKFILHSHKFQTSLEIT